jgi:sporulation protein YlmC with PRC-barrel domain
MYGNILSLITQFLTPDVVARLAQAAGISDRSIAQKAVGAAVPSILSGLAGLAAKPDGARQLADTIARQPTDMLGKITSMMGSTTQLADSGKSMLTSLLGSGTFGSIAGAIARFVGIDESATRSLLGMITPAILGVLGREAGTEPSALAQLLTSQKDAFAAAMPAGLSDYLKPEMLGDRAAAAVRAAPAYRERAGAETVRSQAPTSYSWLYWALPLAALAALALYFLGDRAAHQTAEVVPAAKNELPGPVAGKMAEGELQGRIASEVAALTQTLHEARDSRSVAAALPKLQQASGELERLANLASRLPPEAREKVAEAIRSRIASATRSIETVDALPGLPSDARPVLTALRNRIETLGSAAALAQARGGLASERVVYITQLPSGAVAISTFFDRSVQNPAGQKVGTVNDLLVASDGRIVAAIVGVGGFLGIGEKEVSVPFTTVRVMRRDNDWYLLMDTSKEALADAPPYQHTGERVRLDPRPAGAQK